MAANKFELHAEVRHDVGTSASRRLRHLDKIPGIVYGANEPAVSLVLDHSKMLHALANEAFYSHILILKVNDKNEKVILKAVQRHPSKPRVSHMDFLRVRADQKLHMHVPFHFIGDKIAPGLKEGGIVSHLMSDVEVKCLPDDLPEFIEIDVSQLHLDETIHLSEVKLPKGVELVLFAHGVEGHDLPVVSIHEPRIIEEEIPVPVIVPGAEGEVKAEGEAGAEVKAGAEGKETKDPKKESKEMGKEGKEGKEGKRKQSDK